MADADGLSRELLSHVLAGRGHDVAAARTSDGAWREMLRRPPDLLVLDVVLPEEGGLRLLARMRMYEPLARLPVVVVTAMQHKEMVVAMARQGVSSYLLKPDFTLAKFGAALDLIFRDGRPKADPGAAQREIDELLHAGDAALGEPPPDPEPGPPASAHPPSPAEAAAQLREYKPLVTRSEIGALLERCSDLRGMSPVVAEVIELTGNDDCEVDDVVAAVRQDPGMCVKLLRLANARDEDRGEAVQTVTTAVTRLGLRAVRRAVINLGVIEGFSDSPDPRFNAMHFWEHGLATGLIAEAATRALGGDDEAADAAFTAGLLHDTGRLVYADLMPDAYGRVLDVAESLGLPVEDVEARLLLVGHAEATDRLFRQWNFPRHLIDPIVFHHHAPADARRAAPKHARQCAVLALADRLAHALALGHSGNPTLYPLDEPLAALGLGDGFVGEAVRTVPDRMREMRKVWLSRVNGGWVSHLEQLRQQLDDPPRPLFVGRETVAHPVALCLGRLLGPEPEPATGPPDLAVLPINGKHEADAAAQRLREAESAAGVADLPVLVVASSSSSSSPRPGPGVLGGRPRRDFALPGSRFALIDHLNQLTAPRPAAAA